MSLGATILAGSGFFADAYGKKRAQYASARSGEGVGISGSCSAFADLFVINIVKNVLATLYPQSSAASAGLATAALVGAVIGQLVFGSLADFLGRRVIFISTICLIIFGSVGSALCFDSENYPLYTQLFIWRGVLGFGIGGACKYPLLQDGHVG